MGAVNTTYTFTPTDTITSTKMNNIIDETVMTTDAVLSSGGLEIASGKLAISANAINSSRLAAGSVSNTNVSDTAAIAGTKISPDFGTQNIQATGNVSIANTGACIVQANSGTVSGQLYSSSTNSSVAIGSVSNNPLVAFTNNTERMRITAAGNVGVGTPSPENKLEAVGNGVIVASRASTTAGNAKIEAQASNYWSAPTFTGTSLNQFGSTATGTTLGLPNANLGFLAFQNTSTGLIYTNGSTPIVFGTVSAERMRITAAGSVGIGTSNPKSGLHVYGSGQSTANITDSGNKNAFLRVSDSSTAAGSGGGIIFASSQSDDTGAVGMAAIKGLLVDSGTNTSGDLAFSTRNSSSDTALTERMRIEAAGNVGIGKTNPNTKLDVNGTVTATAFAGPLTGSASNVNDGVITAPKLSGAQTGTAPVYGIRAYARVQGNGTVDINKGFSSISRGGNGFYDLTLTTAPSAGSVPAITATCHTPSGNSYNFNAAVQINSSTSFTVKTGYEDVPSLNDADFSIMVIY